MAHNSAFEKTRIVELFLCGITDECSHVRILQLLVRLPDNGYRCLLQGNQPSAVCLRHGKYRRKYRSRKIVGTTSRFATLKYVPAIMAILYRTLLTRKLTVPTSIVILILGIFAGIANNGNQFMVSTSATEARDFANGLFLTAANLGTTLGTAISGMFITVWGTQSSPLGAVAFCLLEWQALLSGIA